MPRITKPLLAATYETGAAAFPLLATPKIDGIRFLMVDGQAVSRSFKPIRNRHIQRLLGSALPDGVDGELTVGENFQDSTSGVMSGDGEPDFTVWVFDYVDPYSSEILPYTERLIQLGCLNLEGLNNLFRVRVLNRPEMIHNEDELAEIEARYTEEGFEGVMLRNPNGTYKMGRATLKSQILMKVKQFVDAEAEVIGYEELMHNENEAEKDAFGRTKRGKSLDGLVPAGTLGALIVRDAEGVEFKIGTGFDAATRQALWNERDALLGRLAKFKSMTHGVKDRPRHPVFLGFRHQDDLG